MVDEMRISFVNIHTLATSMSHCDDLDDINWEIDRWENDGGTTYQQSKIASNPY